MARPVSPRGQGRARVLHAALEMFAAHGVSGSSLQMIADHLGVTKAAVYYQFKAKDEIVLAVIEPALEELRRVVDEAEAAPAAQESLDIAVRGLVEMMIDQREVVATLFRDPEVQQILGDNEEFLELTERLVVILGGPAAGVRRRVAASMFGASLAAVGVDPLIADLDPETLREELVLLSRALFAASGV